MAERYKLEFLEIGVNKDHVHFLVQSVPTYSVTKIVRMLKRLTVREIFRLKSADSIYAGRAAVRGVLRRSSLRSRSGASSILNDHVRRFLTDHNRRGIGVA